MLLRGPWGCERVSSEAERVQITLFSISTVHLGEPVVTPEQIKLVQQSFTKIAPIADQAADLFYDRLFKTAPTVRPMFPKDLTVQKQKLMQMLSIAVTNLHQVETILPAVEELGRKHVGYGTKPEHYDTVGETLLWTLEQGLGEGFDADVEAAWAATYAMIAGVMKSAAAEVAMPGR